MDQDLVRKIETNPHYIQLVKDRTKFGWLLTFAMLVVYDGFILLIALKKEVLSIPVGNGVMSDFYTTGGGITGFQNGLAIAGDYTGYPAQKVRSETGIGAAGASGH